MSLSEKTRKSNHLQMLEKRQHLLLNYFKTSSVGPAANRARASSTIAWHPTNLVATTLTSKSEKTVKSNLYSHRLVLFHAQFEYLPERSFPDW